jgi:prepilin-type N-terminal cleavage/methylation domain-containing protein
MRSTQHRKRREAFTLVEMLAAVAVLSLLILLLAQVVELTSQAISVNANKLDSTGQARLVFDRLAADLASRARRSDLGMVFTKAVGNDSFQFYSEISGYNGARQIAAVGYRIQETTAGPEYQLERGAVGTDWVTAPGSDPNPLVAFLPSVLAAAANTDPNYDVLANGVFRLEFCFLLNTGYLSNSNGSKLSGSAASTDFSNVTAVVVALAVLDSKSRKIISTAQLQQLSDALKDNADGASSDSSCQDPLSTWQTNMAQTSFAAGVPLQAVRGIRLYQRNFYVP